MLFSITIAVAESIASEKNGSLGKEQLSLAKVERESYAMESRFAT